MSESKIKQENGGNWGIRGVPTLGDGDQLNLSDLGAPVRSLLEEKARPEYVHPESPEEKADADAYSVLIGSDSKKMIKILATLTRDQREAMYARVENTNNYLKRQAKDQKHLISFLLSLPQDLIGLEVIRNFVDTPFSEEIQRFINMGIIDPDKALQSRRSQAAFLEANEQFTESVALFEYAKEFIPPADSLESEVDPDESLDQLKDAWKQGQNVVLEAGKGRTEEELYQLILEALRSVTENPGKVPKEAFVIAFLAGVRSEGESVYDTRGQSLIVDAVLELDFGTFNSLVNPFILTKSKNPYKFANLLLNQKDSLFDAGLLEKAKYTLTKFVGLKNDGSGNISSYIDFLLSKIPTDQEIATCVEQLFSYSDYNFLDHFRDWELFVSGVTGQISNEKWMGLAPDRLDRYKARYETQYKSYLEEIISNIRKKYQDISDKLTLQDYTLAITDYTWSKDISGSTTPRSSVPEKMADELKAEIVNTLIAKVVSLFKENWEDALEACQSLDDMGDVVFPYTYFYEDFMTPEHLAYFNELQRRYDTKFASLLNAHLEQMKEDFVGKINSCKSASTLSSLTEDVENSIRGLKEQYTFYEKKDLVYELLEKLLADLKREIGKKSSELNLQE